jgi:hypothetical protein
MTKMYDVLNIVGPYVTGYGELTQRGFNHLGIQPIRFQGSLRISQSDFSIVENRSDDVLRHGDFTQWGFKHQGIQPIRFQGPMAMSQSDFGNVEN